MIRSAVAVELSVHHKTQSHKEPEIILCLRVFVLNAVAYVGDQVHFVAAVNFFGAINVQAS